jgi:phosphoribosylglycinamide formyltransferase-1
VDELVNLVVDLHDERFAADALARARAGLGASGLTLSSSEAADEHVLAWIDEQFGGTWSSEAHAGGNIVARRNGEMAGFATYDPQGLRFSWLRGLGREAGVGIFGPFGVAEQFRGAGIGPQVLTESLARLRERGYRRALIPAVGEARLVAYYQRHAGARVAERFSKSRWLGQRIRTVVLASGRGTNFQAVLERARDGRLPLEIAALVCNAPEAHVVERARAAEIPTRIVAWERARESRSSYDDRLRATVAAEKPDLVLLLGWMHLLDRAFVETFPHAINIHPAFLPLDQSRGVVTMPDGSVQPAFRGAHALRDALRAGMAWTGATAHRVEVTTDRGAILARKPLRIPSDRTEEQVLTELHPVEHRALTAAILRWVYER